MLVPPEYKLTQKQKDTYSSSQTEVEKRKASERIKEDIRVFLLNDKNKIQKLNSNEFGYNPLKANKKQKAMRL